MTRRESRSSDDAGEPTPNGTPTRTGSGTVDSLTDHEVIPDGGSTPEATSTSAETDTAAADATTTSYDESTAVTDPSEDAEDGAPGGQIRYRTRPTIKPSLAWIGLTLVIGGALAAALFQNLLGLEDPELSSILGWIVVFVVVIVVARFLVRIYILTRTQYLITNDTIRYEFTLWFRRRSRDVPFTQVRGHELDQNRIQRAFGVGTVAVLTGGTNASLGYVEFHNVPHPGRVRSIIRERTRKFADQRR
ncbi:PH domain-containing protein [Natrialbaceae archaeon AArc-T1-2]|uniref:PH domain-containing protein n=1 Tax=Natrialbaceae archaeon AArc-T1-2 TaxID=3053904 RepID=UPI00255A8B25|nr:PH domain-containing protein [Natrialbaceae archaeon AArc-T1-2]WIV66127.1 PH domain-containing protein [Natrialbaceae archaeon AArc-T1-2]